MDAVKFIEEHKKLCEGYVTCSGRPANDNNDRCRFSVTLGDEAAKQIELLEEWAAAHPRKTRQSVFLEQYPEALVFDGGTLSACPVLFSSEYRNAYGGCESPYGPCAECRREFWMQEVE